MRKKLLSIILSVAVALTMMPAMTAVSFAGGNDLYYMLEDNETGKVLHIKARLAENYESFDSSQSAPWYDRESEKIEKVIIEDEIQPKGISYWFCSGENGESDSNIQSITGFENLGTSKIVNADYAFAGLKNITTAGKCIDLSNVESAEGMFRNSGLGSEFLNSSMATATGKLTNADYMFSGCSNLTDFKFPAGFRATSCKELLSSSSVKAVDVSEWTPYEGSNMESMFKDCSNLTKIISDMDADWSGITGCRGYDMFKGCSELAGGEGTVYSADNTGLEFARADKVGSEGASGAGYFTAQEKPEPDYLCFTSTGETTVSFRNWKEMNLEYSEGDTSHWAKAQSDTEIALGDGEKVYFRGKEDHNYDSYLGFAMKSESGGTIAASGSVMTLLADPTKCTDLCFCGLFRQCDILTSAPELPAETLANSCYNAMFDGCTGLSAAPELPAETLAERCYVGMFRGCTGLTEAPALESTSLADYCYNSMFISCTNLTEIPELPAEELPDGCYFEMFYNCSSIKLSEDLKHECDSEFRIPVTDSENVGESSLKDMFGETGGSFRGTPEINKPYYLSSNLTKTPAKKATFNADGSMEYWTCDTCGKHFADENAATEISKADYLIPKATAAISKKSFAYNGKTQKPSVTVRDSKGNAIRSVKVTNNGIKSVGRGTVTIALSGNYSGTKTLTYKVNPKGATIKKPKRAKKAFKAKWKRQSGKMATSRITGYQIQYSTSSSFAGARTVSVKGYKKTSKKIKKLKRKTKYYVKVRTYKTVNGVNYYSGWSKTKAVKTR